MFTWICPQCGRENPPSYTECPDCAAREKSKTGSSYAASVPAAAPPVEAPRTAVNLTPPPRERVAEPVAPKQGGLPTWLMSIVFALAFLGIGAGAYWAVQYLRGTGQAAAPPALENPPVARGQVKAHPLQKYIEVAGIRLTLNAKKQTEARFVVVNHSGAEISDLAANVTVWGRTAKSDEESVGSFAIKLPSLRPYESKELAVPFQTKLRVYELPDWQNVTGEIQITSP